MKYVVEINTSGIDAHRGDYMSVRDYLDCEMYICTEVDAKNKRDAINKGSIQIYKHMAAKVNGQIQSSAG